MWAFEGSCVKPKNNKRTVVCFQCRPIENQEPTLTSRQLRYRRSTKEVLNRSKTYCLMVWGDSWFSFFPWNCHFISMRHSENFGETLFCRTSVFIFVSIAEIIIVIYLFQFKALVRKKNLVRKKILLVNIVNFKNICWL